MPGPVFMAIKKYQSGIKVSTIYIAAALRTAALKTKHSFKNKFTINRLYFKTIRMMQKFLIPQIDDLPFKTTIQGQDARHIFKVLRLKPGTSVTITNGKGKDYTAVILSVSTSTIEIEVIRELASHYESPAAITLCSGMLKDKKMDMVIKHVTQLGIGRWIPFYSERCVPVPDDKRLENRHKRWISIAKESLKQCRRSCLVDILKPVSFQDLLVSTQDCDLKIAFWEKAALPLSALKRPEQLSSIAVLIGPEGGFSENEIQLAEEKGFLSCSLGPRILRAETASISSCTLIQHLFGDI